MKISELITKLQAVQAEHGDLRVLVLNGECGYDEHDWLGVAEFFPSGNKYAGGERLAAYLDFSQSH